MRTRESNNNNSKKKKRKTELKRECRARPGLEACLCLCLGLIDFPEKLLFTASSLESNEAFWHLPSHHPANISTALLRSAHFIFFHSLLLRYIRSLAHTNTHTLSITNKHTFAYTGREKILVLHRQQTKDQ